MTRLLSDLMESTVSAPDGELGALYDAFFDDDSWAIHSLAVATMDWLPGLALLLSPRALAPMDPAAPLLVTRFLRATIQEHPVAIEDNAVSRQRGAHHGERGPWHPYWLSTPSAIEASASIAPLRTGIADQETASRPGDADHQPSLRSARKLAGYEVRARGERLGELVDFVVREDDWKLTSLVVELDAAEPGTRTLVDCARATHVRWHQRRVSVDLPGADARTSPTFRAGVPLTPALEARIADHYRQRERQEAERGAE